MVDKFERPNAPCQPRRWQPCGARRVAAREKRQSRAQVKGRASGVVLHAVVGQQLSFSNNMVALLIYCEVILAIDNNILHYLKTDGLVMIECCISIIVSFHKE